MQGWNGIIDESNSSFLASVCSKWYHLFDDKEAKLER